jgi:hypothetical protein
MLEASAKRAVPARGQEDSPELHAIKRSKVEEVSKDLTACTKHLENYKTRGEIYNVKENSRKEVTISSAPPPAMAVGRGRSNKSTSPPCHEDLPRTGGLLAKGLDQDTQDRFVTLKRLNGGPEMRRIEPNVELWRDYKPGPSFSDHEVEKMALSAWRYQLRKRAEYLPDRRLPDQVHLDHVKILGAALRDLKNLRIEANMSWIECLKYQHKNYDTGYHVTLAAQDSSWTRLWMTLASY